MTKVIFRKFKKGDVIALFPDIMETKYAVSCYEHNGQHGHAVYDYIVKITTLATPEQYKPLYDELVSVGYDDLKVIKKYIR